MIFGFVTDNKKQKQIIKIFIYLLILLEYKVYIYTFLLLAACLGACLAGESDESKQAGRQTERKTDRRRPSSNCWGRSFGPSARARKTKSTTSCSYFLNRVFCHTPFFLFIQDAGVMYFDSYSTNVSVEACSFTSNEGYVVKSQLALGME